MKEPLLLSICTALVLSLCMSYFSVSTYGQSQEIANSSSKTTSDNSVISVSASVTVQVSNESLKSKEGMLRSSVISFLNSGPNVLKTPESNQPDVKTKIVNQINNDTQSVQGLEATNAIIGVEVSKALRSLVSSSDKPNQNAIVTIQTSSTCKPLAIKSISCENTVTIK
jgi:hypothetical protein